MERVPQLNLYATHKHSCSYLPEEEASTIFVDPNYPVDAFVYSRLSEIGFRRSGEHIYRPHCDQCQACIPLRLPVAAFQPNRRQQRCWNKNQDLEIHITEDIGSGEHYALYENYIRHRHSDGDMYPPSREQYDSFLSAQWDVTHYVEFRQGHRLLSLAVTDVLDHAVSAIYTFFDPLEAKRSLGIYSVLFQIELAKKLDLPYVYLGYWIQNSPKMAYKSQYQPYELFLAGEWQRYTENQPFIYPSSK